MAIEMKGRKRSKSEKVTFYQNPFYESLFGNLNAVVPSKRIGYKQNEKKHITRITVTPSSIDFENQLKKALSEDKDPKFPFKGNLFLAISIALSKKDYETKDLDNMIKTLFDGMKGIVYEDDSQICSVFVNKYITDRKQGFMVGIRELSEKERGWYVPALFSEKPWPGQENRK